MSAIKTKRAFRASRPASDAAAYPASDEGTNRCAFLGRLGWILAGGAAVALVGCSSRPVNGEEGEPDPPQSDGAPEPPQPDGAPEPPQPDGGPGGQDDQGGAMDIMPLPPDSGSGDDH